jgi:tetratricopeptide (TPR) repeat protein
MRKILCLILLVVLLMGCESVRLVKKATSYERSGMYEQAVANFLQSLERKPLKNERAIVGLKRTALLWTDQLLLQIDDAYATNDDDAVVNIYQQLSYLKNDAAPYGVQLVIPGRTNIQYNEARTRYEFNHYQAAQASLDNDDFQQAIVHLERIMKINPGYEQTRELYNYARCEPLYRSALESMDRGHYRSAWNKLERVRLIDSNYDDLANLQREARVAGLMTIALRYYPEELRRYPALYRHVDAELKSRFYKLNHPFIQLVSEEYIQQMMEEQRRSLSEHRQVDPFAMIPVRVQFTGSVVQYRVEDGPVRKTERKAWLKETDRERKTVYKKVSLYEVEQSCVVTMTFSYEFVSVENARVLVAGKVSDSFHDAVRYATSAYNPNDLVPGDWGAGRKDTLYTDVQRRSEMLTLLSARRELKKPIDFDSDFAIRIAADVIRRISAYDPEK